MYIYFFLLCNQFISAWRSICPCCVVHNTWPSSSSFLGRVFTSVLSCRFPFSQCSCFIICDRIFPERYFGEIIYFLRNGICIPGTVLIFCDLCEFSTNSIDVLVHHQRSHSSCSQQLVNEGEQSAFLCTNRRCINWWCTALCCCTGKFFRRLVHCVEW